MKRTKQAFTIVELMLAVAFLGTLLLSIAMLTMQLINIYTKGATMRAINSTGSSMMRDIRSSIGASKDYAPINDYTKNNTLAEKNYIFRDNSKDAKSNYGMFCTGSYSYVWNYQSAMLEYRDSKSETSPSYLSIASNDGTVRPYAFARIKDNGCNIFNNTRDSSDTTKKIDGIDKEDLTILLDGSTSGEGTDLALYDFSVLTVSRNLVNSKAIFNISFVLGTTRGGVNVTSSSNYCKLNKNEAAQNAGGSALDMSDVTMDYCSVNRFEFTVRQTGSKSGIGV